MHTESKCEKDVQYETTQTVRFKPEISGLCFDPKISGSFLLLRIRNSRFMHLFGAQVCVNYKTDVTLTVTAVHLVTEITTIQALHL